MQFDVNEQVLKRFSRDFVLVRNEQRCVALARVSKCGELANDPGLIAEDLMADRVSEIWRNLPKEFHTKARALFHELSLSLSLSLLLRIF